MYISATPQLDGRVAQLAKSRLGRLDNYCVQNSVTVDVEEQAAGLQHWKQEFIQLSSGSFRGSVEDIWFANTQLFRDRCNQSVHQRGESWAGSRTIALVVDAEGDGVFSGSSIRKGDLVTLANGKSLDFRTPRNVDCLAIALDEKLISEHAATVWGTDAYESLPECGQILAAESELRTISELLTAIYRSVAQSPEILSFSQISRSMEEQILGSIVMLGLKSSGTSANHSLYMSRQRIVNRTRDLLVERAGEFLTVSDICRHLDISRRSLQYAFETICEMSPMTYLKYVRLNHVRRELKKKRGYPGCTVGDVAAAQGFWHLSRFSSEYRQLFGELPSVTLGRAPVKAEVAAHQVAAIAPL